jgi:hypothetical protein
MVDLLGMLTIRLATFKLKRLGSNKMNNTKVKELENEIVDYIMDNWGSNETEVKLNYLRLLVTKYCEGKAK